MNTLQLTKHFKGRYRNGDDSLKRRVRCAAEHLATEGTSAVIRHPVGECRPLRSLEFNYENITTFICCSDIKDRVFVGNESCRIERITHLDRLGERLVVAFQNGIDKVQQDRLVTGSAKQIMHKCVPVRWNQRSGLHFVGFGFFRRSVRNFFRDCFHSFRYCTVPGVICKRNFLRLPLAAWSGNSLRRPSTECKLSAILPHTSRRLLLVFTYQTSPSQGRNTSQKKWVLAANPFPGGQGNGSRG